MVSSGSGRPIDCSRARVRAPRPEASRATLLRRVSVDLIGLPPSVAELEAFLADPAPDAYERAVDRLLTHPGPFRESPLFGYLDRETLVQLHRIHTAHHLSFLVPKPAAGGRGG